MAATGPSRCSVGPGKFPGRRDQLAPQDGHDRKPAVPRLDQAPDAGDRDIGEDRGNHVGGGRQCPRQHGRAAIRRGRRRPGHGHRFPPSRAADGTRRVLAPPVPAGHLHLVLPESLVVTGQGITRRVSHMPIVRRASVLRHQRRWSFEESEACPGPPAAQQTGRLARGKPGYRPGTTPGENHAPPVRPWAQPAHQHRARHDRCHVHRAKERSHD